MSNIKIGIMVIMICMLTACGEDFFTTTLEIDPPAYTPQIVTHAFLNYDTKEFNALVSETTSLTDIDAQGQLRSDATITILSDTGAEQFIDNNNSFIFNFRSTNVIDTESLYEIEVQVPGFETVSKASQQILSNVKVSDFKFSQNGGIDNDGNGRSSVDIVIEDPVDEENYYEICIMLWNGSIGNPNYNSTYTSSNDPIVSRSYNYNSVLLSDATFNGNNKELKLQMYTISEDDAAQRLYLKTRTVTKEYYQFSRTLERFDELEDNPFATPVQIFTNFDNGIGIFSVYRESLLKVF